jgi:hypothetical protein
MTRLVEPVRTGAQTNTAQSLTLALDYADVAADAKLRGALVAAARKFYLGDTTCATHLERVVSAVGGRGGRGAAGGRGAGRGANPDTTVRSTLPNDLTAAATAGRGAATPPPGAAEILSPCLTEAALMSRVLEPRAYLTWLNRFLPPLQSGRFAPLTEPIAIPVAAPPAAGRGGVIDTSASAALAAANALATERARLAALSFSRAQAMERIARALPASDPRVAAWHRLSAIQASRGFELMRNDSAGIYWLPAQALLYGTVGAQ